MTYKRALKPLAILTAALALSGCVSVFPKDKPAQMYRFGVTEAPTAVQTGVGIARTPTVFNRSAAGDRILTVTGQELAYVAGARWVAPAAVMFDDAVEQAFEARANGPRYVTRGDLTTATIGLRLEVDTFETRYLNGAESAPTVAVSVRASLVRLRDHAVMGEKVFSVSQPAADNRVGDIAAAYDSAVKKSVGDMVDWSAATVGG